MATHLGTGLGPPSWPGAPRGVRGQSGGARPERCPRGTEAVTLAQQQMLEAVPLTARLDHMPIYPDSSTNALKSQAPESDFHKPRRGGAWSGSGQPLPQGIGQLAPTLPAHIWRSVAVAVRNLCTNPLVLLLPSELGPVSTPWPPRSSMPATCCPRVPQNPGFLCLSGVMGGVGPTRESWCPRNHVPPAPAQQAGCAQCGARPSEAAWLPALLSAGPVLGVEFLAETIKPKSRSADLLLPVGPGWEATEAGRPYYERNRPALSTEPCYGVCQGQAHPHVCARSHAT